MDYDFQRLDLHDERDADRRSGWLQAVQRGFRAARPNDEFEKHWHQTARTDNHIVTGAWLPPDAFGAGPVPVATLATFDKSINLGHELLPARLVTDVTTSPAHRRRGLAKRLMEDSLASAVADGVPLSALTATEATIYGRWGFGVATIWQKVELDTTPGFALRSFADRGRVEFVDVRTAWPLVSGFFERFHEKTRGSVAWPAFYEHLHTGTFDYEDGEDRRLLGVVHLDTAEEVDGFALFRFKDEGKGDDHFVNVVEMVALNHTSQLGLWQFLASIDRVSKVRHGIAHPEDPLRWALSDFRRLKYAESGEFLWLRVLDVPRVLEARPWSADGDVVIAVDDAQGHAAGTFRLVTRDGRASVQAGGATPQVRLTAETLATLVLGPVSVRTLHRAGRLEAAAHDADLFAAMADLAVPAYSLTGF